MALLRQYADAGKAIFIVAAVTVLFILSAGTGVKRGIKWLRNANMGLDVILMFAFIFILCNLLVDITYAYLDPRIRYQ